MRDRLIELLRKAEIKEPPIHRKIIDFAEVGVLADYLLANGVIVPPCKVGDTVYVIFEKKIYEAIAEQVTLATCMSGGKIIRIRAEFDIEDWFYNDGRKTKYGVYRIYPDDIFLTKEEAEQALRKEYGGK